jgi:hypothetical protein
MITPEVAFGPFSLEGATPAARQSRFRGVLWVGALAGVMSLAACIVVPQTREIYDSECRTMTRQVTLQTAVIGRFAGCSNDGCAALLVATGAVTAASAVVSGSIALVGNVVYWFERQGNCAPLAPPAPPPR